MAAGRPRARSNKIRSRGRVEGLISLIYRQAKGAPNQRSAVDGWRLRGFPGWPGRRNVVRYDVIAGARGWLGPKRPFWNANRRQCHGWQVARATLGCDARTRRIPAWLPVPAVLVLWVPGTAKSIDFSSRKMIIVQSPQSGVDDA